MSRLIFVPQFPTPMRYQYFWVNLFKDFFKDHYDEVIVLGEESIDKHIIKYRIMNTSEKYTNNFSLVNISEKFELKQMKEFVNLKLKKDDVLFVSDISFPGLFSNILYHKRPDKCFAFCHATSLNYLDYFSKNVESKYLVESGHSTMFDKVFVGSEYHREKLHWLNTEVIGLPTPPSDYIRYIPTDNRDRNIISVNRKTPQKVDSDLEMKVEKLSGYEIERITCNDWTKYSKLLSSSKILFISSREDTFGYTILDAIKCGCIPVAPNRLCFPEILSNEYLYNDEFEAYEIITKILDGKLGVPVGVLGHADKFFDRLKLSMLG
jgi:hypothetical protein